MISPFRSLLLRMPLICCCAVPLCGQSGTDAAKSGAPLHAPRSCPWLTEGSAATLLGGEVSMIVTVAESGEGNCKFTRRQEPLTSLDVVVSKSVPLACPPSSTPLKGIGNEAFVCRTAGAHGLAMETISGRVRDQYFTVSIDFSRRKTAPQSSEFSEELMEQVAEQVAGNLF